MKRTIFPLAIAFLLAGCNLYKAIALRLVLFFLIPLSHTRAFAQVPKEDFVRRIETLRKKNKLTVKEYPGKTSVGSLTGYYENGILVLINSLTDAEFGGRESLYYIKNGALHQVLIATIE